MEKDKKNILNVKFENIEIEKNQKNETGQKNGKKPLNIKQIGMDKLIIIFLAGIFIIVLSVPDMLSKSTSKKDAKSQVNPSNVVSSDTINSSEDDSSNYSSKLEEKLKSVLKKVDGLGDVEVMITLQSSKELVTLKDSPYTQDTTNETDGSGGSRISSNISKNDESVLITSEDGESTPYVIKEIEPQVEGVVVIAQGGGDQSIAAEIIDAVEVLFDVPTHKIKVMKMNSR